ncbi:ABC transporter ATP-binding protein [Candidatus Stoquefichus sp. SB1]|uniref:ABC transporter ATP-binding protein n=1 Tax=Candidatus Stoquefichus sp. SB1 TaxID=1658109 RepID=UPI00067EBD00|nr:ATP-binding cassette domain-containing protein [Candidatus Stoquefichus sp. SB1]
MSAIIKLERINKSYGDHVIFKDYSLEIEENEIMVIMGKSGVGKTTLLNIIGLIEDIDSGKILLNHQEVQKKDKRKMHSEMIGFIFQNFALLEEKTVLYNLQIVFPTIKLRKKNRNKMIDALKMVGLDGYENKLVCECSGGEKQRIALARLIVHDSQIILADEPTGSLDQENKDKILELLVKLKEQGKTIIVVTHDDSFKAISDKHLVLQKS